jgi:hypothetical protein
VRAAFTALAALVLAGCAGGGHSTTTETSHLEYSLEPMTIPERVRAGECFAAVPGVTILGQALGGPPPCGVVAHRFFAGRRRRAWPPPLLRSPDAITACILRRPAQDLSVQTLDEGSSERAYTLATRICRSLRRAGWRRVPFGS